MQLTDVFRDVANCLNQTLIGSEQLALIESVVLIENLLIAITHHLIDKSTFGIGCCWSNRWWYKGCYR
jgi:hypothetical protein